MASLKGTADDEEKLDPTQSDSRAIQHQEELSSPLQQQQMPHSGVQQNQYSTIQARSSPHRRPRMSPGHRNPAIHGYPQARNVPPHQYGPPQLISARSAANAVTPDSRSFMPPGMTSPPTSSMRKRTVLTPGSAMSSSSISPSKTGKNQGMYYIHGRYVYILKYPF